MAVFTPLSLQEAQTIGHAFSLKITHLQPITEGITNSNFLIKTQDNQQYILTIIEQYAFSESHQIIQLLNSLPACIPHPPLCLYHKDSDLYCFNNKPVVICAFMDGKNTCAPTTQQISQIADAMAHMHRYKTTIYPKNRRNITWMKMVANKIAHNLSISEKSLLQQTLKEITTSDFTPLSKSLIHHDLFKDNALFLDNKLTAIIDFYYATYDYTLIDIAIIINDWCFSAPELFLEPYLNKHTLHDKELNQLPLFRRYACLNFWLSRLLDLHVPSRSGTTTIKNPDEMRDKLIQLS